MTRSPFGTIAFDGLVASFGCHQNAKPVSVDAMAMEAIEHAATPSCKKKDQMNSASVSAVDPMVNMFSGDR